MRRRTWVTIAGSAVFLVAVSGGSAAGEMSVPATSARATSETQPSPFRFLRPARDLEVLLWATRQRIGEAGRSPLGVGKQAPLCQAIKGVRAKPVRSLGCGLPLLRQRPPRTTKATVGARPRGFSLSVAQLDALAAGIEGAVDRQWARVLRRARQAEPTIDAATRKIANQQAEAIRGDKGVLTAAEQVRQAIDRTFEGRLARYRTVIRKYAAWLPGIRQASLAAVRSINERARSPRPAVERTYTGPWATIELPRGTGDWDTSDSLQLGPNVPGDAVNTTVHARAGFNSSARYKKYYLLDFTVPAGAGAVEVEIDRDPTDYARLDDCFGFASGWVTRGFMIYRVQANTVDLRDDPVVSGDWALTHADVLTSPTTCGGQQGLPVPDPPNLQPSAPAILRFTAPSSGADYMLIAYVKAEAEVTGGGTAVVEQDVATHSVVVRHQG